MLFAYLSRITSNFLFFLIIFPDFTEPASLLLRYPHLLTVETGKHYFHTPTSDFHPSATRSPSKCSKAPPLPAPSPPPAPGVRSLHQSTDNPVQLHDQLIEYPLPRLGHRIRRPAIGAQSTGVTDADVSRVPPGTMRTRQSHVPTLLYLSVQPDHIMIPNPVKSSYPVPTVNVRRAKILPSLRSRAMNNNCVYFSHCVIILNH